MKKVLSHRITATLAISALIVGSMTFVGGPKYPVAFGVLWVTFGVAVIRRDTKA